ncbi:MAG: pyridoxal 5'-phosphate synthase glutaminase subunit PdxT [Chthonomonas sp.]|nr:pyridoxal 5'-phosphate synthase glutaminase subunit PdxT [Chthonomonas sp.]
MRVVVGIVSIQGNFAKHAEAVQAAGGSSKEVRTPTDLAGVDRLIIPGGESSTVGMLMQRFGLGEAIVAAVAEGMPIWGTCMGMILMAREVEDRDQFRLNLLDIKVRRNAFGRQVHSFEQQIPMVGLTEPVTAVFIRAPVVVERADDVQVLAAIDDQVVAVRQGNRLGTSFHPELTDDVSVHRYFLGF